MKVEIEVEDIVKRIVRESTTSGRVNVPKEWIGREVQTCLLPAKSIPRKTGMI